MDQGLSELVFRNALHVPNLASNLISRNKFNKAGFSITFAGGQVKFQDPSSQDVLCGVDNGGMYLLGSLGGTNTPSAMTARSQMKPTTIKTWHRHFGHLSMKTIRKVLADNLVDSLEIKGNLTAPGLCEDCVYSKHASIAIPVAVKQEEVSVPPENILLGRV